MKTLLVVSLSLAITLTACMPSLFTGSDSKPASDQPADFYRFDAPPTLVESVLPDYPADARAERVEGSVLVKVLVDVDGSVFSTAVLRSSDQRFESAALDAVSQWKFTPAELESKPTRAYVAIPVKFEL